MNAAYTADEVAELLRVNRSTVYRHIKAGEIPSIVIGTSIRVPAEWVHKTFGAPVEPGVAETVAAGEFS